MTDKLQNGCKVTLFSGNKRIFQHFSSLFFAYVSNRSQSTPGAPIQSERLKLPVRAVRTGSPSRPDCNGAHLLMLPMFLDFPCAYQHVAFSINNQGLSMQSYVPVFPYTPNDSHVSFLVIISYLASCGFPAGQLLFSLSLYHSDFIHTGSSSYTVPSVPEVSKLLHPLRFHLSSIKSLSIGLAPVEHIMLLYPMARRIPSIAFNKIYHLFIFILPPFILCHIIPVLIKLSWPLVPTSTIH